MSLLATDALESFICLKILCVVGASDAMPGNKSPDGGGEFVRIRQANNYKCMRVGCSDELG